MSWRLSDEYNRATLTAGRMGAKGPRSCRPALRGVLCFGNRLGIEVVIGIVFEPMHYVYTFLIMLGLWILFSGKLDAFHVTLGIFSSGIVSLLSRDLLFQDLDKKGRIGEAWRFLAYLPWLLKEIVLAAFHVVYLALHPNMKDLIAPRIVRFRTRLKRDISRVTLATSITLTPGTITVRVTDDEFLVHALSRKVADSLPGPMEGRVERVFEDTPR